MSKKFPEISPILIPLVPQGPFVSSKGRLLGLGTRG